MTDREAACELYSVLDALMDLFESGRIPVPIADWPKLKPGEDPAVAISVEALPKEQQESMRVVMVLVEAQNTLEALRETYYDTTASS